MTGSSPYVGHRSYSVDAVKLFFGREDEIRRIIDHINAFRLTVVYGPAGAGKSSILRAGVEPRLQDQFDVIHASGWRNHPLAVIAAGADTLPGALEQFLRDRGHASGKEPLLVLDRFEDYFMFHPGGPDSFDGQLAVAVNARDLPATFVISIREEAYTRLDRLRALIPGLLRHSLRVDFLTRDQARAAIVGPLDAVDAAAEAELVEAVLNGTEVAPAGYPKVPSYHPADLQWIMKRVWDAEAAAGSRFMRLQTLEKLGGAARLVSRRIDDALLGMSRGDRGAAARMLTFLVTPSGRPIEHNESDLAQLARHEPHRAKGLLEALANRGILSRTSRENEVTYRLVPGVAGAAVLDWRQRYRSSLRMRGLALAFAALLLLVLAATGIAVFAFRERNKAVAARGATDRALSIAQDYARAADERRRQAELQAELSKMELDRQSTRAVSLRQQIDATEKRALEAEIRARNLMIQVVR
jgi:hypothetical protein